MRKVFINYRVGDSEKAAVHLRTELGRRIGNDNVFFASADVRPGTFFPQEIYNAVSQCDIMLVLVGRQWLHIKDRAGHRKIDGLDDWVRLEIEAALHQQKRIIPLLLDPVHRLDRSQLPVSIAAVADSHWLEFRYDFAEHDIALILRAIGEPWWKRPIAKLTAAALVAIAVIFASINLFDQERTPAEPRQVRHGSVTLVPSYMPCDGRQDKIDIDSGSPGHGNQPQTPCAPQGGLAEIILEDTEIHTADENRLVVLTSGSGAKDDVHICGMAVADRAALVNTVQLADLRIGSVMCVLTDRDYIGCVEVTEVASGDDARLSFDYTVWQP